MRASFPLSPLTYPTEEMRLGEVEGPSAGDVTARCGELLELIVLQGRLGWGPYLSTPGPCTEPQQMASGPCFSASCQPKQEAYTLSTLLFVVVESLSHI